MSIMKAFVKRRKAMCRYNAFKFNRILMDLRKAMEMFKISYGFLCYFADKKKDYILFLRLKN